MYTLGLCVCGILMEGIRCGFSLARSGSNWNLGGIVISLLTGVFIIALETILVLPILGRIFGKW